MRYLRIHLTAGLMTLVAAAGPPVAVGQSCVDGGAPLRAELERVHEEQRNVGLAVGIRRGDEVIFREDYGFADLIDVENFAQLCLGM